MSDAICDAYHRWYYERPATTWQTLTWCGVPLLKNPLDLLIIQELITAIRPTTIVETGTYCGGSALFYATVCAVVAPRCLIVTVDQAAERVVDHPSIFPVPGDSVAPATLAHVRGLISTGPPGPCLVLLDSDHSAAHVLAELRAYSPLVTPGSYLVVEDTNLNGHPVVPEFGPGPAEAVAQWMAEDAPPFVPDPHCERLGVTWSPGGWLRRTDG